MTLFVLKHCTNALSYSRLEQVPQLEKQYIVCTLYTTEHVIMIMFVYALPIIVSPVTALVILVLRLWHKVSRTAFTFKHYRKLMFVDTPQNVHLCITPSACACLIKNVYRREWESIPCEAYPYDK